MEPLITSKVVEPLITSNVLQLLTPDLNRLVIEDLLELTSDKEFMTSSSWNLILPEYPMSGSSQTLPSLQLSQQATAPVPRPLLQQFTTPVPQLSLQPTPRSYANTRKFQEATRKKSIKCMRVWYTRVSKSSCTVCMYIYNVCMWCSY